ncbi:MAG: sugar phosphate isomerase/epimerase family protein [Armatimonadota bacterium]
MKTGISTIALRKYDVFKAIKLAKSAGFDGVEIWGKPPHITEVYDESHIKKVKDAVDANGLVVCMYGSYVKPGTDGSDNLFDDSIKIAKLLDTKLIRIWPGAKEPQDADEDYWEMVIDKLIEYGDIAEDNGLILSLEVHGGTLSATTDGAERIIDMTNHNAIKLNWQIDLEEGDFEKVLGRLAKYTASVHAQNFKENAEGKMELSLISEGVVDYRKALDILNKNGFNGFVEVEFLKGEFDEDENIMLNSLKADAEFLREITSKFNS